MLPLFSALIACVTIGVVLRDITRTAAALALLANWCVNTLFVTCTGDTYPWLWFIVADYLTALSIVALCRGGWPRAIVAIYAAQIVAHVGFGLSHKGVAEHYYGWWTLYYLAWAQVATFAGWTVDGLVRRTRRLARRLSSSEPGLARPAENEG